MTTLWQFTVQHGWVFLPALLSFFALAALWLHGWNAGWEVGNAARHADKLKASRVALRLRQEADK